MKAHGISALPSASRVNERGMVVQYFEGAVLMRTGQGRVLVAPVVREQAKALRVQTAPVAQNDLPEYSETLLWTTDNPNPLGDPNASGRKWIEISISQQTLWAYQGGTLISSTLVSTGTRSQHHRRGAIPRPLQAAHPGHGRDDQCQWRGRRAGPGGG